MRVLVEQTEKLARDLMAKLPEGTVKPEVHVVMGGEDAGAWHLYPERPAILIGTQDMLLSRALNRGYAAARARWPVEFGLLHQDALWVMDEVQLMDVGLATSAQLQAFRDDDNQKALRPCRTWWMSATLQPDWLCSVDTQHRHSSWVERPCTVPCTQRLGGLWEIEKSLQLEEIPSKDNRSLASRVLEEHAKLVDGEFGRITLVVCNTVERACKVFECLETKGRTYELELVHSRFRSAERRPWRDRFLSRSACRQGVERIIVATQVVEAGVDMSAGCLVTELAPWPSLVQRFGRCARYGGTGRIVVVNRGVDKASTAPYSPESLGNTWASLASLQARGAGILALESFEDTLELEEKKRLYPFSPSHLLLRKEFDELFDTTPDLSGADIDISRFLRTGEERDLQIFWRELAKGEKPDPKVRAQRAELCAVPFLKARDWLCGKETKDRRKPKLTPGVAAWVWDWLDGGWREVTRADLVPGRVVCVSAASGGYSINRGFDPASKDKVSVVPDTGPLVVGPTNCDDDQQDSERVSVSSWKTIAFHSSEVASQVSEITRLLGLPAQMCEVLELAAHYHDWGKSHPAFQGAMRDAASTDPTQRRLLRQDLAKGPDWSWRREFLYKFPDDSDTRPGFRHELASTLALFALLQTYAPRHPALLGPWAEVLLRLECRPIPECSSGRPGPLIQSVLDCSAETFDLFVYLVASHHGKVRVSLQATPKDQDYRDRDGRGLPICGVREGDILPPLPWGQDSPELPGVSLSLSPASIGLSEHTGISWRERCLSLLERLGPTSLAFLESILRAADVRASQLETEDPSLAEEAES